MKPFEFEPIGYLTSCYKERFGTPRQPGLAPDSYAILKLRPELNLTDALEGLEGFSHIWLIFVFHQNTNKGIKTKVHPPRMGGDKIGLFATRTPHRPNPIGLSVVKLEGIRRPGERGHDDEGQIENGAEILLSGIDLIDGTPILDIKPYLPAADSLPDATSGWVETQPVREIEVQFSDPAVQDLTSLLSNISDSRISLERIKELIHQSITLDPRPNFYKGTPEHPDPYTDSYGFRLDDMNVVFKMSGNVATVVAAQPWAEFLATRPSRIQP